MVEGDILNEYLQNKNGYFYVFDQTEPICTYIFGFAAGEYVSIELPEADRYRVTIYSYSEHSYDHIQYEFLPLRAIKIRQFHL